MKRRVTHSILGSNVDVLTWDRTLELIRQWAREREARIICICNVHMAVTARTDSRLSQILSSADMVTPDGAPIAWVLKRSGHPLQQRINGPDLMWRYLRYAEEDGEGVFFYGGSSATLDLLGKKIRSEFPGLNIAGLVSPPFKTLTDHEKETYVSMINASGASVVFVGLGCPKQEKWMLDHRNRLNAVMIGVGAAFDYHAGTLKRAPLWMQDAGLEWLHRLSSEPRRLWRRYFVTNMCFLFYMALKGFRVPADKS